MVHTRKLVWERDNYTCQYCGLNMKQLYIDWLAGRIKRKRALLTVDHIYPRSKGGGNTLDNLLTACKFCNNKKGNKVAENYFMDIQTSEKKRYEYCQSALHIEKKIKKGFVVLAEMLYNIREKNLYEPAWSSFQEFSMEFKEISSSTISKLCSVYEKYVIDYKISPEKLYPAGWTILYQALPLMKSKEDATEFLNKGNILSREDIKKEIKELRTGIDTTKCRHKETYKIEVCSDCGERWKCN